MKDEKDDVRKRRGRNIPCKGRALCLKHSGIEDGCVWLERRVHGRKCGLNERLEIAWKGHVYHANRFGLITIERRM